MEIKVLLTYVTLFNHPPTRMKSEWMNELPPKFHLEGSNSRCFISSRGEEFHLSSLSEVKDSVESQKDEKMRNECERDERTPRFRWPLDLGEATKFIVILEW